MLNLYITSMPSCIGYVLLHMCAKSLQLCLTLCDPMDCSPPGSCPWDSTGKNTGMGYHALLQGIFPTQGSNPSLMSPALAGGFFTTEPPGKPLLMHVYYCK